MHRPAADLIVIDTLGRLYAHGYELTGYCRVCRRYLRVPMLALIAARGADIIVRSPASSRSPAPAAEGGRRYLLLISRARKFACCHAMLSAPMWALIREALRAARPVQRTL
jgi:hypothetical protein